MRQPSLVGTRPWIAAIVAIVAHAAIALLALVMLMPGCGRSSLEPEVLSDGGTTAKPPVACGPQNCPTGCCDATGTCRVGSDLRACGSTGGKCSDCVAQGLDFCSDRKTCGRTVAQCNASTCPNGCCSVDAAGRQQCLQGIEATSCGRGGARCEDCVSEGRSCDASTRACTVGKCDASNCDGCCVGDKCLPGLDNASCGTKGEACSSCKAGQLCDKSATGGGGGVCRGTTSCGPANCGGCCLPDGTCVAGTDSTACGKQGAACALCAAGQTCAPNGDPNERTCQTPPACSPANCAGCCQGNNCVIATTPAACGKGGLSCSACKVNEICNGGVCEPAAGCNAANCAGCCIGDICASGNQNTACGAGGDLCTNCTGQGGKVCQGGTCQQPACGPGNCAGCCAGNTCVVGTQDNACGPANGAQCSNCTLNNQMCDNRQCIDKCGPGNCAGCCLGNACAPGFARNACGSGGAACSNCNAAGSVCDVDARTCSAANSCPKTYNSCPKALTTPVTPSVQKVCSTLDLDAIQSACGSADSASCVAAFKVLAMTSGACAACLSPFDVPFSKLEGLYRCAAPFVNADCNHSTACAVDCVDTSCDGCPAVNEDTCRGNVSGNGGQCSTYVLPTTCIAGALGNNQLCSPLTYGGSFADWIRAIGAHFCGNGP
ncbi:hypothetical protein AKJ09_10201 [Labilithrix luteola]|uniref:Uncharacterized protein n=1 Tax=Labilithrix luteola TaxID=1391654 RepID=A0A0K1QCT2_9BACT|nr:hypothetical protein [Labilithrix luteola]AKV03538.1 hypothetical protein AKJ09_10201 [Labilithrix luteola]